jgi:hypothetical protein
VVNLTSLTSQAYVAVQSAPRERYREVQAGVEKEMASLRARDNAWEDLLDVSDLPFLSLFQSFFYKVGMER